MSNEILMTQAGFDLLKEELEFLKTTKRAEIAEKIRVARGFGDLSENSEYDAAKDAQAVAESRINTLENQIKTIKIISKEDMSCDVVSIGSKIRLLDINYNEELTFLIISALETVNTMETITDESPVGKAIIGKKINDIIEVLLPNGTVNQFKLLEIIL